jgi:U3 small nucleolar RNA-associated protein 21
VATDDELISYKRQKQERKIIAKISHLQTFGELLIAIHKDSIIIYNHDLELMNELSIKATMTLHPNTYLNKILVVNSKIMQLWNINTMKLVFEFKPFEHEISCIVQSPSIDIIAIGFLNGLVLLYNIKQDKEILRFTQSATVTAISFRTDLKPIMATASDEGEICLWDLEERKLVHIVNAHESSIHTLFFYHGSSILVTAADDNSIKQWIFDQEDHSPRLLKQRSGHTKPPTKIEFYGPNGDQILSTGEDQSLRFTSVIRDSRNCELSQGKLAHASKKLNIQMDMLKIPEIVQFYSSILF